MEREITKDVQKPVLVTGAAGSIGFHLALEMLRAGWKVTGLDNINDYYDVGLKRDRLSLLSKFQGFSFLKHSLSDHCSIEDIFKRYSFDLVVHVAAQAGVRYSFINPRAYIQSNIEKFLNVLEDCRQNQVKHLLFALSRSVYGGKEKIPFSTHDNVDYPVTLYAAIRKSERTHGPRLRSFVRNSLRRSAFLYRLQPVGTAGHGAVSSHPRNSRRKTDPDFQHCLMVRDFTYIDDAVEAVARLIAHPPAPTPQWIGWSPTPALASPGLGTIILERTNPSNRSNLYRPYKITCKSGL